MLKSVAPLALAIFFATGYKKHQVSHMILQCQHLRTAAPVVQLGTLGVGDPGQVSDPQSFQPHQLPSFDDFIIIPFHL